MATSPIYGWLEPDNTDLVKNGALAIRTLGNAIDTTMATMTPKSIVDAKGDIIAASANDTPARLAVGNNGETLVADSSTSTGLRYTAGTVISNPILNSAMQIWQRGTTSATTASIYTADRWQKGSATTYNQSRQVTGDTTNLPNIQYCLRTQRTAGSTSTSAIELSQSMESAVSIPYAGKTVTFSFYARAGANYSSSANGLTAYLYSGTSTDANLFAGGFTGAVAVINTVVTLTTTWQRFTVTGTVGATATQLAPYIVYAPTGTAGANDYFEITGVQIDVGSVALPFRTNGATLQGEFSACQRYYETGQSAIWSGNVTSGSNYYLNIPFAVVKRTNTPTITLVTTGVNGFPSVSTASINAASFRITGTANTTGSGCYLAADSWNGSAEL
jgi:hypothetical protein